MIIHNAVEPYPTKISFALSKNNADADNTANKII